MTFLRKIVPSLPVLGIVLFHSLVIFPQLFTPGSYVRLSDFIFPYAKIETIKELFLYSWTAYGFGQPSIPTIAMGFLYILNPLFGGPLSQQIIGFLPLLVASLGMYLFLMKSEWFPSRWWAAILSILFSVNWLVFAYEGDNTTLFTVTGLMWTYASIPFFMLFAHRIFISRQNTLRNILGLSLASLMASISNSQSALLLSICLLPFIACYLTESYFFEKKNIGQITRFLATALGGWGVIFGLLIFPILFQLFDSVFFSGGVTSIYGGKGVMRPSSEIYSSIFPFMLSPFMSLSSPNLKDFPWALTGFLFPVVIFLGIRGEKDQSKKILGLFFLFFILFLSIWFELIYQKSILVSILYRLPILGQLMQALRLPFKYSIFLGPFLILLFALGIKNILQHKKHLLLVLPIILLPIIGTFFNHDKRVFVMRDIYLGEKATFSSQGGHHAVPFNVPQNIIRLIAQEIEKIGRPLDRYLWLPNENEIWQQTSQVNFRNLISYPSTIDIGHYQDEIANSLSNNSKSNLANILTYINIRYIVVLKFIKQTGKPRVWGQSPWGEHIVGSPTEFMLILSDQENIEKVKETDLFALYENINLR